jgi:hypothetical protein
MPMPVSCTAIEAICVAASNETAISTPPRCVNFRALVSSEQLDFCQRHVDVPCHHQPLVEDAVEDVDEPGVSAGAPVEVGRR